MENADAFSSSTAPLTWHDFLERMRQPAAAEFVKAIKSFIVSFSNNTPDPERDSAAVQHFLSKMEAAFRAHPLWAGCSEEELDSAGEGLEKYVMTKLFTRVFASVLDDAKVDEELSEKMALVQQFIRPENLDIKPIYQNESSWLLAQKELQKINMYKAPREKLACILSCCKVINNLLLNASLASNENPPGADDFLPILIYVTIKANPPQLHSNLQYIQRYRRQSRIVSETAYFFTNMLSAESFISNIDAKSLSMDETEFEQNIESSRALLSGLSTDFENSSTVGNTPRSKPMDYKQQSVVSGKRDSQSSGPKSGSKEESPVKDQLLMMRSMSISDLEEKGGTLLLKEDQMRSVFQQFPYLFANVGDLTVRDVEDLLSNYKQLVFKYVCLLKGLGVDSPSMSASVSEAQTQNPGEAMKVSQGERTRETSHEIWEDVPRSDDGVNDNLHREVGTSESDPPQEEGALLKGDKSSSEAIATPLEDCKSELPEEGSALASAEQKTSEEEPPTSQEQHENVS